MHVAPGVQVAVIIQRVDEHVDPFEAESRAQPVEGQVSLALHWVVH